MQYYQLFAARLPDQFIKNANLDDCEVLILLKESISMIQSMVQFEFDKQLFQTIDCFKREQFFCCQEFMNGKSMCDLYITEDTELSKQLDKELEQIEDHDCHFMS